MRKLLAPVVLLCAALAGAATRIVQDQCGPFTDVSPALCPYVLEMFYLGITAGTSPTTYSPDNPVTRGQAAVFVSKGVNQAIARSSRRAALGQWWTTTPPWALGLGVTAVGDFAGQPAADGTDIWVPTDQSIDRVRASDGKLLESWTGANGATAVLVAMGRIFVTGQLPQTLYMIDPAAPAGVAQAVATNVAENGPQAIAFDGSRIWTANCCLIPGPKQPPIPGSISIITPGTWSVQNVTTGFDAPIGLVFDGTNIWVADTPGMLRLDAAGAVTLTVPMSSIGNPAFDGANLWVPNANGVSVVRASTGEVLATMSQSNIRDQVGSATAAFDGRRVLIARSEGTVELWDAQTLSPLGTFQSGSKLTMGACSDGVNFWVTLLDLGSITSGLGRF